MKKTENYNLGKPELRDFYDVNVQNDNMDIIDAELKKQEEHIKDEENPHKVTAKQVGLENVDNKSSETIRSEITTENITNALGYTPVTETDLAEVNDKAEKAQAIAKGRNQAHVFSTTASMQTWLSDAENKGKYNVGDNIYIIDVGVPDWWVSEVLDEADTNTGYYYKIAQLETQKVDLTNIENDINTLQDDVNELNSDISTLNSKLVIKTLYYETVLTNCKSSGTITLSEDLSAYSFVIMHLYQQNINTYYEVFVRTINANSNIRQYFNGSDYINFVGSQCLGKSFTFTISNSDILLAGVDGVFKK